MADTYSPLAEWLSTPAVTHPGWYGYAFGVSGDPRMVIDQGPNSLAGDSLMQAETVDAPDRWTPFAMLASRQNLPPLMFDGTAQRAHPNILGLVEFTPIGPGEVWLRDIQPCSQPQDQFDIEAWITGLGQLANNIALVYPAGEYQGEGAVQGSGLTQLESILPSDFAVAYVGGHAPNPSGPTLDGNTPPSGGILAYFANLFSGNSG